MKTVVSGLCRATCKPFKMIRPSKPDLPEKNSRHDVGCFDEALNQKSPVIPEGLTGLNTTVQITVF